MNYRWNIAFSYTLAEESYDLELFQVSTLFAEGVRVVSEKRDLPGGVGITMSAEPAPGGEGLFPVADRVQLSLQPQGRSPDGVLLNGYQSWTETRERDPQELPKRLRSFFRPWIRKYLLERYGDAWFTGSSFGKREYHGFSWAALRFGDTILLLAGLSEEKGFSRIRWQPSGSRNGSGNSSGNSSGKGGGTLVFEPELSKKPISGVQNLLNLLILEGPEEDLFSCWGEESLFTLPQGGRKASPVAGWTSWYDYYEKVSEKDVLRVLGSWKRLELPGTYIQIDDGWQQKVGDWLNVKDTFPRGMAALAEDIRNAGMEPGLWLAPFVAEEASDLFREHREWFLKGRNGEPLAAGYNPFNWSGNFYALNYRHPELRAYLKRVFQQLVEEWGFRLLKLDFLYAAALEAPEGVTRGRAMREAMEFIREISGDAEILACGVPLLSAAGLVDYCRIGGDVGLTWEDSRLKAIAYPERVSTINSIRNCINRRSLDGVFFGNDPDVYILRDWNCKLKEEEKFTLFLCNNIFGSLLFTSDDPGMYRSEELALFRSAFPLRRKESIKVDRLGERYHAEFTIGRLRYNAFINLEDRHHRFELPPGLHYGSHIDNGPETSTESESGFRRGGDLELRGHSSACFLFVEDEGITIAGSTGQLFPGSEVEVFHLHGSRVDLRLSSEAVLDGNLYLRLPMHLDSCTVNGSPYSGEDKVDFKLVVIPKDRF
jgi:alpha-galactosidase